MVELTRCLGYYNRENTVFKRSHSSEKCVQDEDKRCVRSFGRERVHDRERPGPSENQASVMRVM